METNNLTLDAIQVAFCKENKRYYTYTNQHELSKLEDAIRSKLTYTQPVRYSHIIELEDGAILAVANITVDSKNPLKKEQELVLINPTTNNATKVYNMGYCDLVMLYVENGWALFKNRKYEPSYFDTLHNPWKWYAHSLDGQAILKDSNNEPSIT